MIRGILRNGIGFAASGAVRGCIYAKLANFPVGSVAKAWAIWAAASYALGQVAASFSSNPTHQVFITLGVSNLVDAIGIYELRKRGIMGDKLMYFIIINNIAVAIFFTTGAVNRLVDMYNEVVDARDRIPHFI